MTKTKLGTRAEDKEEKKGVKIYSQIVGENIKRMRKSKGLTQKQLGDLCGIDASNIGKYERGLQDPRTSTLEKIAEVLNIDIFELLGTSREQIKKDSNLRKIAPEMYEIFRNSEGYRGTDEQEIEIFDKVETEEKETMQKALNILKERNYQTEGYYRDEVRKTYFLVVFKNNERQMIDLQGARYIVKHFEVAEKTQQNLHDMQNLAEQSIISALQPADSDILEEYERRKANTQERHENTDTLKK